MSQIHRIYFLASKDLNRFFRDWLALFFFLLFPLLFIMLFTVMNQPEGEDPRLTFHLVTQETAAGISHQVIEAIKTKDESQLKPGEPFFVWLKDYNEARQKVEDREIAGFVAFPSDFTEGISTGEGAELEVVVDAEAIEDKAALHGLADAIATQIGSELVVVNASIELLIEQGILDPADTAAIEEAVQQIFQGMEGTSPGASFIEYKTEKVGEVEAENAVNWALTGYLVMFVFFAAALSAEAIVRERQTNTLERLLASSVRSEAILGGMFTGSAAKGLVQIIVFWVVGILAFNADVGLAPTAVIILSILMVIVSSAFGIMLATLVKTQRAAGSIAVLTSLILAPLGGCWWPLFILPKWMQGLAKITPHGWANTGFNKLLLFGADFGDVVPEMLVLLGFAVVFGGIAIWRFRTSATQ